MLKMVDLGERSCRNIKDGGSWREFFALVNFNVPELFSVSGKLSPTGYSICNARVTTQALTLSYIKHRRLWVWKLASLNGLYLQHNNGLSGTNTGWKMKQHYHGTITAEIITNSVVLVLILVVPTLLETHLHLLLTGTNSAAPMNRDFLPSLPCRCAVPCQSLVFTANQDSFYTDTRTQLVP